MKRFTRAATHGVYTQIVKPLLFTQPPDVVHAKAVKMGRRVGRYPAIRNLSSAMWAYKNPRLSQTIHGLHYDNPVGLSAGFDKNAQLVPIMQAIGFGHITVGSITSNVCEGNPKPWYHRLPEQKAIVVHAGLANTGCDAVAAALREFRVNQKNRQHAPLTISVARTNSPQTSTDQEGIDDYLQSLKTLRLYADIFEINISCPNTYGGEPFTTPAQQEQTGSAHLETSIEAKRFIIDPDPQTISNYLNEAVVGLTVHHYFAEAALAYSAAQMVAMRNSHDNAKQESKKLQVKYNSARRAVIDSKIRELYGTRAVTKVKKKVDET